MAESQRVGPMTKAKAKPKRERECPDRICKGHGGGTRWFHAPAAPKPKARRDCGCGLKVCRGECGRAEEPKARTVVAWAVVCGDGRLHWDRVSGLLLYEGDEELDSVTARDQAAFMDDGKKPYKCGPHGHVRLSGVVKRARRAN